MRVHFVIHESFESAGAYLPWAESRGYTITWSHVYAGEAVPANADGFDMLVVFGGPQSPGPRWQSARTLILRPSSI